MDESLTQVQEIVLEKINQICGKFGLNNIMAQLYALLYLSNKALCLDDMVDRLKISKGSVSINIRSLERYNAVRKVWVRGSRKDYYEAEEDIAQVLMERIKSMTQKRLREIDEMLVSVSAAPSLVESFAGGNGNADVHRFKEKIQRLRDLHTHAQALFDLFNIGLFGNILNPKAENQERQAGKVKEAVDVAMLRCSA